MKHRVSDFQQLISKRSVALHLFPNDKPSYGWQKLKWAFGDDPVLYNAFHSSRRYLYISEYQYITSNF